MTARGARATRVDNRGQRADHQPIARWFTKRNKQSDKLFDEAFAAVQLAHSTLIGRVSSVVVTMVSRAIKHNGEQLDSLPDSSRRAAAVLVIIAADYLSARAHVPLETTALLGGLGLLYDETSDVKAHELMEQAGARFNDLASDPTRKQLIADAGATIGRWFSSNDSTLVERLARSYHDLARELSERDDA